MNKKQVQPNTTESIPLFPQPHPPQKNTSLYWPFPYTSSYLFGASQVGQPLTIDPIGSITGLLAPQRRVGFDVFKIGEFLWIVPW